MRTTRAERHSPASYAELSTFIGNLVLDCDDAEDVAAERDRLMAEVDTIAATFCELIAYTPMPYDVGTHRIRSCLSMLRNRRPTGVSPEGAMSVLQAEVEQLRRNCALYKADAEKYAKERDEARDLAAENERGWKAASEHAEGLERQLTAAEESQELHETRDERNDASVERNDAVRYKLSADKEVEDARDFAAEVQAQLKSAIAERDRARYDLTATNKHLIIVEAERDSLLVDEKHLRDRIQQIVAERDRLREELASSECNDVIAERDRVRAEREDFRDKIMAEYKEVCALSRNFQAERDAAIARAEKAERERDAWKEEAEDNEADIEAGERACVERDALSARVWKLETLLRESRIYIARYTSPTVTEAAHGSVVDHIDAALGVKP